MPTPLHLEQARWHTLKPRLSPAVQAEVEQRLQAWQQPITPATTAVPATLPTAVLVRRPGLTPRPLDPLFFEVVDPPTL